jgi:hypothetical protein
MFPAITLLALGFTNLAMLGWLAAAAAPILIHLWSRHRFREAPWAAMQFLLAAMRKNARRMQLQQWLLLAVRTLLIVLVVLAVAEPYGEQLVAGSTSGPAHKVLVLDGSYSMAYRGAAETNFERAKNLAADLVRKGRPGDTFTVLLMSEPPRTLVGRETVDQSTIATQIESLAQLHTGADLRATLSLINEALTAEEKARKPSVRQEVYFFTDLQRATWQRAGASPPPAQSAIRNPQSEIIKDEGTAVESDLEALFTPFAQRAALAVIDVGQSRASNLAVTRLSTPEPFVTIDREIAFEATLHQFGDQPQLQCAVELVVDDVPVAEQTIDIPAGGEASVRFVHRFRSSGEHTIAVRTVGDRLPIDNARWLVLPAREEIRVLCVAGREGAANYLADALNPNPAASSAIRPIIVSEGDLAELELSEFDCIFLCNVAQFTSSEAQRLQNYAAAGGGLVFFLGDRVMPAAYNRLAEAGSHALRGSPILRHSRGDELAPSTQSVETLHSHAERGNELLPARIGELISPSQFGLDPLEYRHPIVAPFRGRERAGLLTTPVTRYYQLETPRDRPGIEVAVATRDGNPFIVAAPLGRGRTILVATDGSLSSVDPNTGEPWTTWPTWPSFLPIVRELLAYAAGGQHDNWEQPVGTTLGGPLTELAPASTANLQITRPDGRTAPINLRNSPGAREWNYNVTDLSGIYSLPGSSQSDIRRFAVNVDTAESDLAKVDPQTLPPQLIVRETEQGTTGSRAASVLSHAAWNEQLLWIALALLFVESFLAWQFGRGAA